MSVKKTWELRVTLQLLRSLFIRYILEVNDTLAMLVSTVARVSLQVLQLPPCPTTQICAKGEGANLICPLV